MQSPIEIEFLGGPADGLSYAYTSNDSPLPRVRFQLGESYSLYLVKLPASRTSKFMYVHSSLKNFVFTLV